MSEPELGSDVAAIKASARKDGEEYVLDGSKMWVTNGLMSGLVFVLDAHRPRGVAAASRVDVLHRREGTGRDARTRA